MNIHGTQDLDFEFRLWNNIGGKVNENEDEKSSETRQETKSEGRD